MKEFYITNTIARSPFFFARLRFLGLIFNTPADVKSLQKLGIFTSARVQETEVSVKKKERKTGNRVCNLKFFHFPLSQ